MKDELDRKESLPFLVPSDEKIKKRWIENVFDCCVRKSHHVPMSVDTVFYSLCKEIVARSPCQFSLRDVSQIICENFINDFRAKVDQICAGNKKTLVDFEIEYFAKMLDTCLVHETDIIGVCDFISKMVVKNWLVMPSFIAIMMITSRFHVNIRDKECVEKMQNVMKIIKSFLYKKELQKCRKEARHILRELEAAIEFSYPKFDLHVDNINGVENSFIEIVEKTVNQRAYYGFDLVITNFHANAKFYLENATKSLQRARDFSRMLRIILHDENDTTKRFQIELNTLCEEKFMKQQKDSTKKNYSEVEIFATIHFICELLVKGFFPTKTGQKLLKIVESQASNSYVPLFKIALSCSETNPRPKET